MGVFGKVNAVAPEPTSTESQSAPSPADAAKASQAGDHTGHDQVTKQILVLYTGGTIGMVTTDHGYDCKEGYLFEKLAENPRFNDGLSKDKLAVAKSPRGYRIEYKVNEYWPLLDSSDMNVKDWLRIAGDIAKSYDDYDGFIVLHGTDTMAYTASALAFMLQNLAKPVILTGSQIPFSQLRNDAQDNLLEALIAVADFSLPEVLIVFAHKLIRGCRATKLSSNQLGAFDSPNCKPLGTVGISFNVDWDRIRRPNVEKGFELVSTMSNEIGILYLFPGITAQTVEAFFASGLRGVVLKTFGAGNFSQQDDILAVLTNACERGVVIVNTTQCAFGGVAAAAYAAGEKLQRAGVTTGLDMTTEAAATKLSLLIGMRLEPAAVRAKIPENLAGELTVPDTTFSLVHNTFITAIAKAMNMRTEAESKQICDAIMPTLLCTAAADNDHVQLAELLKTGGRPNMADYDKRTPLHVACHQGALESVELLLQHGADPNVVDKDGHSPLFDACVGNHRNIVKRLREISAHLHLSEAEAVSIFCGLVKDQKVEELETWALAGADFNVGDYDQRTPLHIAADEGLVDTHALLIKHGANPSSDRWGNLSSSIGSTSKPRRSKVEAHAAAPSA
jgi:lysophospholipase